MKQIKNIKGLIFDLDGTIADTIEAIREAINDTMKHYGYSEKSYEDVRRAIGNGARLLVKRCMSKEKAEDEALVDEVFAYYHEAYKRTYLNTRACYDGIPETIAVLKKRGFRLAVLSNKQDEYTKGLINQLLPADTMTVVMGQSDLPKKPDPTVPCLIAEKLGLKPEECAMIGDSEVDIETAKNAGMTAIGCSWGYRGKEVLEKNGADVVLDQPTDLWEVFGINYTVESIIDGTKEWKYTVPDLFLEDGTGYQSCQGNSWDICYQKFRDAIKSGSPDYDDLALHLAFYLASWGMYRGSSFLKSLDYRIHVPAVKMMLEQQYRELFTLDLLSKPERYHELLFKKEENEGIYCRLNQYYGAARASWMNWKKNHAADDADKDKEIATDTLLTKILLGVYGCIPAYDVNFKKGISCFAGIQSLTSTGDAIWKLNKDRSQKKNTLFYVLQKEELTDELKAYAEIHNIPFMKAVDMYFFGLGDLCFAINAAKKAAGKAETAQSEISKELIKVGYLEENNGKDA